MLFTSPKWKEIEATVILGGEARKWTKTGLSGYTISSYTHVGLDLNNDNELELEEIVWLTRSDKAKRKENGYSLNASNFNHEV